MKQDEFIIHFGWSEPEKRTTERVGRMYCFKKCDVNQN